MVSGIGRSVERPLPSTATSVSMPARARLALGMSARQKFIYITSPLAIRIALPAYSNDVISLLKSTALDREPSGGIGIWVQDSLVEIRNYRLDN